MNSSTVPVTRDLFAPNPYDPFQREAWTPADCRDGALAAGDQHERHTLGGQPLPESPLLAVDLVGGDPL